ncbi:dihydrofolate reductase family protein [Deinococcus altitudinis]|uniref:dihydrofolate reductase family protein n=1 Tax=Deinococcus altitudinis TaxID=468914 RepID=UPI003891C648
MSDSAPPARKVVLTLFMSLDGVIEEPGDWGGPYRSDDGRAFKEAELFGADLLLLGRVTYEGFARYWPGAEGGGAFAARMNSLPKVVATTTLSKPEWNASFVADVAGEVERLKRQPGGDILIYGSGTLAQTLMKHNLIDEYRLLVYPLVLGHGQRLFPHPAAPLQLTLVSTQTLGSGVVALTYQPKSL